MIAICFSRYTRALQSCSLGVSLKTEWTHHVVQWIELFPLTLFLERSRESFPFKPNLTWIFLNWRRENWVTRRKIERLLLWSLSKRYESDYLTCDRRVIARIVTRLKSFEWSFCWPVLNAQFLQLLTSRSSCCEFLKILQANCDNNIKSKPFSWKIRRL